MIDHGHTTRTTSPLKSQRPIPLQAGRPTHPLGRIRWDRVLFLVAYLGVWVALVTLAGAVVRMLFG